MAIEIVLGDDVIDGGKGERLVRGLEYVRQRRKVVAITKIQLIEMPTTIQKENTKLFHSINQQTLFERNWKSATHVPIVPSHISYLSEQVFAWNMGVLRTAIIMFLRFLMNSIEYFLLYLFRSSLYGDVIRYAPLTHDNFRPAIEGCHKGLAKQIKN